jgi:hypothetical protein
MEDYSFQTLIYENDIELVHFDYLNFEKDELYIKLPFKNYINMNLLNLLIKIFNKNFKLITKLIILKNNYFLFNIKLDYYHKDSDEFYIIKNILISSLYITYINSSYCSCPTFLEYKNNLFRITFENHENYFKMKNFHCGLYKSELLYDILLNYDVNYLKNSSYFYYFLNDYYSINRIFDPKKIKEVDTRNKFIYRIKESMINYDNININLILDKTLHIKRKSFTITNDLYKDDSSSLKKKRILEEGEINEEEKKIYSKKARQEKVQESIQEKVQESIQEKVQESIQAQFRIKCNEKTFDIDDKTEFVKTFKQLDYIKMDHSLECYVDDSWIVLNDVVKDILCNES